MHLLLKQHPLPVQMLPLQQAWPGAPHGTQSPLPEVPEHTYPSPQRSASLLVEQHRLFGFPHGEQVPLAHTMPLSHELPQQGWPEAPHPEQWPAVQTPPPAVVAPPALELEPRHALVSAMQVPS
jgi:hypothetical protein